MKILWINDEANFTGGAETYIYQSAQVLCQRYDVQNILLYNVNSRIGYEYSKVFSFASVLVDLKQQINLIKPDIIYVHQVADIEVLKQLSQIEIPVIGFIHDHKHFCLREHKYTTIGHKTCTQAVGANCYSCLGFINKKKDFPYISINSVSNVRAVQNVLKKFRHMVVASEYMKEHLLLHGFREEKISKIILFSKHTNNLYHKGITQEVNRLLFVGQLVRGKGVDTLLNAFAKIQSNEIILDICGDGKQRVELEEQAKHLNISTRVVFHGKVAPDELSNYYMNAYAVVIPSRAPETFNLVGLEAMKHAKAVIGTNVGGIKEWLIDGENGFTFESNDEVKLASLLTFCVNNPNVMKKMGDQGLNNYNESFTPEIHCTKLYNLFESLLLKDSYAV
ncbi:glycosyltransferase family 4 protein [Sulfurimonas sp.]|uniref:glycosyltransferase family 4 protein n=1 Tax=Sulfurimonas sp. TaxID=2022749 RepID=UPI0025DA6A73|nr:glycosyltransferase family 4 protein [Sulfurimonas sp.]